MDPHQPQNSELKRLAASESRLRAVLAGMLDAVVTIDDRGLILEVSDSVERLFGYTPSELVGENISILMPEPHRSLHDDYLAHYRQTGHSWILNTTREFEVVGRQGQSILVELSVSQADLEPGRPSVFVGSFRDITGRKRAERALIASERRFRAIFDQEFQLVALLRSDGRIVESNRTLRHVTGCKRTELLDARIEQAHFWVEPTPEALAAMIRRANDGETSARPSRSATATPSSGSSTCRSSRSPTSARLAPRRAPPPIGSCWKRATSQSK